MWADGRSDGRCNSSGSTTGGCVCDGSAGYSQSSSAKASGKSKIVFKWKAVKGASGYTVFRKEKGGKWKNVAEVKGAKKTAFSDTKVITGTQYTYSVKAFKNTKGKKTFSSYNKKGVTAIAGLYTLKLNSSRITLNPGKSYTLKVNGTKLTPAWRSSNSKIVTVNKKGRITAKKAGTAKITAKCGVFEESRTIQVTGDAKVQVKKITGVPKKKTLKKGKKWSIKAKATPKNVAKLTYKSSDKKVASVNGKGVVKAKKKGKATITIKAGSLKKTCKITVK